MAFYRTKRGENFTVVSNDIVQSQKLTYRARGLLEYMLSLPDDWKFYKSDLIKRSPKEGKKAIEDALKELRQAGYVTIIQKRKKSGQFGKLDWSVADTPAFPPQPQKPSTVKPQTEEPSTVNGQLQNTKSNKELIKQRTNSLSLSRERKKEKDNSVDNFIVDAINGLFTQWGYPLNQHEKKQLSKVVINKPIRMLRGQAEKALSLADDYPFGYMMTLIKNLPDVDIKEKVANE